MKDIIKLNDVVFVRNGINWKVYSFSEFCLFGKEYFIRIGNLRLHNNKYEFFPRNDMLGIRLVSIGENSMKTVSLFIESQNKKLKYLGE